jgi:hypothetical protein
VEKQQVLGPVEEAGQIVGEELLDRTLPVNVERRYRQLVVLVSSERVGIHEAS